jgi:hypothetical protein
MNKLTKEQRVQLLNELSPEHNRSGKKRVSSQVEQYRARFIEDGKLGQYDKSESVKHIITMWIEDKDYEVFLKHYYHFINNLEKELTNGNT